MPRTAQLFGESGVAAAGCQIVPATKQSDPCSVRETAGTWIRQLDFWKANSIARSLRWDSARPATSPTSSLSITLRAQATLRERERRFRELLDALPAAVYTTDAAGRITYYN
ncbi:MAG: hypothetical protein WCB62_13055, partial [Pseudolabrys sp.]